MSVLSYLKKHIFFISLMHVFILTLCAIWPDVDIYIALKLYHLTPFLTNISAGAARNIKYFVAFIVLLSGLLWLIRYFLSHPRKPVHIKYTGLAFLWMVLCTAVGSGLIVNAIFKDNWGRARPAYTVISDTKTFTPFYKPTDQCQRNCSFASGDASAAFTLMAVGWVLRHKFLSLFFLYSGLAFGWIIGLGRMILGRHFLSDVAGAGLLVIFAILIVYFFFRNRSIIKLDTFNEL